MKQHAPAALRNRGPILEVLRRVLPAEGAVLEIASGSGQHVVFFAEALPNLRFLPSDPTPEARASVEAYRAEAGLPNIAPPIALDVLDGGWARPVDAIFCANMIHISPPETLPALFTGGAASLGAGAPLILYGPFRFHGAFLAESNAAFDRSLKSRDARWGVRDVDDVARVAREAGFVIEEPIPMPAENHIIVARRVGA